MKTKVLGLFRIPVSYFNALLEEFSQAPDIELRVAFCIKPANPAILPGQTLNYTFLDGAEEAFSNNTNSERDHTLRQKSIQTLIEAFRPDVLLVNTGYRMPTTWLAISAAEKLHIPIVTRMTTEGVKPRNILKRMAKRLIVGRYCRKMTAGVYECALQRDYMIDYGMDPDHLFFAPCSVDNAFFSALSSRHTKQEAKRILGLGENCVVIADTAQLIDRKRPMDLILAVENLRKDYPLKAYFIGAGPLRDELDSYIREHSLEECSLCGRLSHEDMSVYLCAADIFVMPSEHDASPKALNEAMNFGVAIVVTEGVCTSPEMCREGQNGYIYQAGNVGQLTDRLKMILDRRDGIEEMGAVSREIVSAYSYQKTIQGWRDAIDFCLSLPAKH